MKNKFNFKSIILTLTLLTLGVGQMWAETVLFFQDNIGMSGRFAYFYSNTYWDTNNGAGSNGITSQCNTMTKLGSNGSKDIYVYQISNNCSKVAVMQNSQSNYGNFWETQGCAATQPTNSDEYDGYWTAANPMMIPNQSSSYTKNSGKTTYYHFSWGTPTVWLKHANWDGNNWGWKQMTYNSDGTFTLDANYTNGSGCDRNCTNDGSGATYMDSPTKTPNSTWNHLARFKMTFSGGTINLSITKLCVVTFNMNGHGSAIAAKNVLYNTKVTAPSDPSASGYTFGGWYTNEGCTSPFDFANTNLTDDITLHAKWTAVVSNTLTVQTDGHGSITTPSGGTTSYTIGTPVSIVAADGDGYTFKNWTVESGTATIASSTSKSTTVTVTAGTSATVQANYTEVKSTVTVNANQTSMGTLKFGSTSKSWGTTASVGVTTTQGITATASSGYIFSRWVLSGGAATSSSLTSGTITLKGDGSGDAGIAKAVFGIEYYYKGGKNSWANPSSDKLTPHESGYYAYYQVNGSYEFKITKNASGYDPEYTTIDNSYGNITLGGGNGSNITDPSGVTHYICILYPGTDVNDGANPLIFASTTLPDLAPETTYATTFYAGDHGAINAKGTAIAKNGNASVNIGATARALTATPESGYSFDYWETSGSVTVADIYSASTTVSASAAGGTVRAHYLANSGWYLQGGFDNYDTWETSAKALPVDRPYRGISGVYYRPFSTLDNDDYFGLHDGTNKYSGHESTSSDYNYTSLDQVATLYVNSSKSFQAKTSFSNKWAVINTTGTKTFWIQNPETCHTVTVSNDGAKGTVVLKTDNHGNLTTTQFTNGETIRVEIDTMAHYSIASVTLGATNVTMTHSSGTKYTGTAVMPNSDVTLTVTYTPWYKVQLEVGTVKGNANTPKIYLGSTSSEENVISSGSYVISGSTVIFWVANGAASAAKAGYNWWGFRDAPAGTNESRWTNNSVSVYTIPSISADAHIYAVFGENDYTVTVNTDSHGKVDDLSSTTVAGHIETKVTLPTATADPGYYFVNWTTTAGMLTNSTSATTGKINGLTSTATVTANFAPIWTIAGLGGDWNTNKLPLANTYVDATVNYAYLNIDTLRPNTTYEFKAIQRSQGDPAWWRAENTTDNKDIYYSNSNTRINMSSSDGDNFYLHTAGAGRYTFDVNLDNSKHPIKVHYPTSYTVTFGSAHGTVTATVEDASAITSGQYAAAGKDITFAQTPATGYTFKGWYNAESGGTAISCMASDNVYDDIAGNISVYAQYDPKTYDVTLTNSGTGYSSGGQAKLTATYDAAFPSITLPTAANGYAFMGYWSAANGEGTQFTNASGVLLANITDYSDESGHWKYDASDLVLYAYYKKAEITEITLNAGAFEPVAAGDEGYVVANPTIAPTPAGTTMICWELLYDNDNPVPSGHDASAYTEGDTKPNQVRFSIAGLAAGSYKVRATLHTGSGACGTGTTLSVQEASFTIASDFTVTILYKCGDATIKSSTTNPGKALEGTSITAPDIIGYTFSKWKAGDGVTIDGADGNGEKATATITYTANYNGSLTAIYTQKRMIYFYNTLGWSDVYVYFYKDGNYWDGANGTGTDPTYYSGSHNSAHKGHMLPIEEGSSIYYFDAEGASIPSGYTNIAFTEKQQDNCWYFYDNNKVVRRGDYKATTLPMFVPLGNQPAVNKNGNTAKYYCEGYWMNYPENTGYTLRIYSTPGANNATGASREYLIPYSADKKMPLKQDVEFNFSGESWFIIYRNDGNYLEGSHTFKQTDHDDKVITSTDNAGTASKMRLISDGEGIYTFTLSFHGDDGEPEAYNYYINVDFPAAVGDYRIVYKDNATWSQGSAHNASWYHPSKVIPKIKGGATEAKKDTVSFFISKGAGITATMKFQYISAINASTGAVTWRDGLDEYHEEEEDYTINLSGFSSVITKAGVYNFIVTQPVGGGSISVEGAEAYTGNYYIRTDNAGDTKWNNYRSRDHQMVYTEFSMSAANTTGDKYSHYFTSWCERGTNIQFCIANDYSSCISDTLRQDVGNPYKNTDANGTLESDGSATALQDRYSANVRFMYNEKTNKISRAYVGSATNTERKFLILEGNEVLKGDDNEPISDWDGKYALILVDKQNWIYEHVLKIKPGTRFKLYSNYAQQSVDPDSAQYFRGAYDSNNFTTDANSVILIDGSGGYQMARVLYDFKTNRLMTAWIPSGSDVSGDRVINADVLVEREHQEPAQYITFENGDSKLSGVKTVYGAMKFNRWILNNRQNSSDDDPNHGKTTSDLATYHAPLTVGQQKSIYERSLYFISFPFDVNANEIFGFGHYWDEWYLEYYDGLTRAKNGYWQDSPPNWKYVTPSMLNDFVLKANEGYILGLDLDFMKADNFDFWSNGISTVELFFPSTAAAGTLQQTNCTIPALSAIEGDPYRCTINRGTTEGDRRVKDSYWRCLGVPSFNIYNTWLTDGSGNPITWQPDGNTLPFIYAWNKADNTLTAQSTSTFTFLPMHAYLVQNGGEIRWTNVSAKPASPIVARRANEQPEKKYEWRLALMSDSILIDQTYIKMSNLEQVTDTFDFNQDLIKEFNTYRSDIYTYIGNERVAANSMPLQTEQTTVIPVGVKIKTAGEYTFAMPDGTNGVGVTLIDTETGVRTSLGLMDYTVTLTAGSFNQRFFLEISPVSNVATDIELINDENGENGVTGVRKVLIDNKLFIIKDGEVYDARGAMVK